MQEKNSLSSLSWLPDTGLIAVISVTLEMSNFVLGVMNVVCLVTQYTYEVTFWAGLSYFS